MNTNSRTAGVLDVVDEQAESVEFVVVSPFLRGVRRFEFRLVGFHPDLNKMHPERFVHVVLRVLNTGAGRRELHFAAMDDLRVAHGVLVLQFAVDDVREDFVLAVRVSVEAGGRLHAIFVENAKATEAIGELRVLVRGERPRVEGLQPAVIGVTTGAGRTTSDAELRGHSTLLKLNDIDWQ